jgi:cell division protein FtsB
MKKINIHRLYYRFKTDYLTLNNVVILIAFIIAANFIWGSLQMMQRNFTLQKGLDEASRQLIVAQLDTDNAKLEQKYYQTDEYKELAARQQLGLASPGESVLILPPNSPAVIAADNAAAASTTVKTVPISNFSQWMNFLFGTDNKNITQ